MGNSQFGFISLGEKFNFWTRKANFLQSIQEGGAGAVPRVLVEAIKGRLGILPAWMQSQNKSKHFTSAPGVMPKESDHGVGGVGRFSKDEMVRFERRNLLAISVLSIALSVAGEIPDRIGILGSTINIAHPMLLELLLVCVQTYFIIAFYFYSRAELRAVVAEVFREKKPREIIDLETELREDPAFDNPSDAELDRIVEVMETKAQALENFALHAAKHRQALHYHLPMFIGVIALLLLLMHVFQTYQQYTAIPDSL